jgi:RNA polymerase primary sigma factor
MHRKKKIANEFERSAKTYFSEIGNFSSLSKDEEMTLWEQYKKNNDLSARDKIIKSNLKFVASVAKPFQGLGLSYSDLIAEGNMGLMKAMEKFDYEKGYKTISYSVWWIRQTIMEALNERNLIKGDDLPRDFEKSVESEEENEYNINGNNAELEDGDALSYIKNKDMKSALSVLMKCLTDRERIILMNYYGLLGKEEMTLEEIGKELRLTKERVRQIKEKALKKLRSEALKNSISEDIYK